MKIAAINGSPRGRNSNTHQMVKSFLDGARQANAQTVNIFLAEKHIEHCRGCFACWLKTPGKCIIKDDMEALVQICTNADILLLASPLYVDNITGLMKDFVDRFIVTIDPHFNKDTNGECRHPNRLNKKFPKLIFMSNCGFAERSHFQVVSHWIKRMALNMNTELLCELYTSQGSLLQNNTPCVESIMTEYFDYMSKAGKEIVTDKKISTETQRALNKKFLPDDIFIKYQNNFFDAALSRLQQQS
ncbi:flavodoxin family protein [Pectinatus frisingensis]|uniref:flavodoxin family protein n=1 Tax=Pectinatus frisingensis TaxID=865 RepID=UPI0018C57380|nr:flavodoxin family protein [Pectinatus frisingensis]